MDSKRFDALARVISTPGSRRTAVRAFAGLAFGIGLDARGVGARHNAGPHARQDARDKEASEQSHPAADSQSTSGAHATKGGSCPTGKKRCHGRCIPKRRPCRKPGGVCRDNGLSCKKNHQCCTQHCANHVCAPKLGCTENGNACSQNSDCCTGNCFGQVCAAKVSTCGGTACNPAATGCCAVDGCCQPPANQCNPGGVCCAPNCGGRECGDDGCGNDGACGSCAPGQTCGANGQCQGQPSCSPRSCPHGCCDANGDCQPGNTKAACGDGGAECTQCGPPQYCSLQTGTCRDNPRCSPTTCPNGCCDDNGKCQPGQPGCGPGGPCCTGCCDESNQCQPGTDGGACGANGSACIQCDPLHDLCDHGKCQCDANNCPNGCCDNGPGQPGLCFVDDPRYCGAGGGRACVTCPSGTVCNAQGQCRCTETSCPGDMVCNPQTGQCDPACSPRTCPNGCCDANEKCQPGDETAVCGTGGVACVACVSPMGICCGDRCCSATCCGPNEGCCGIECCRADESCCGDTACCAPDESCCGGAACCSPSEHCCGQECCIPAARCCGGTCCLVGQICCGANNDQCCDPN